VLAGCVSQEQITAGDRARCQSYGFKPGTDGFANCMMQQESARWAAIAERSHSVPTPRQTSCITVAGITSCTTY